MFKSALVFLFFLLFQFLFAQNQEQYLTYYEKSNFEETPGYNETIEYCKLLDEKSNLINYTNFGISPQLRELPLLIINDGDFKLQELKKSDKVIVLIQACIHAGEPDGKDAGLMLLRDIAINKKYVELLKNVCILFIPIFNVDGHERFGPYNRINQNGPKEMGWRTTSINLNMNRDFLKADCFEMKQWLKLYNKWLPDFMIDCHTTDGADYQYHLTYGLEIFGNMSANMTKWLKETYLPETEKGMNKADYKIFPYVAFKNWHDPRSGLISWVANPMLSEGYTAVQNRPGLLIETHMLKDYKTRVNATYEMLKQSLVLLNKEHIKLKEIIKNDDEFCSTELFRKKAFPLKYETTSDNTFVEFEGIDYTSEKSELSGGKWFKYGNQKKTFKIRYFDKQKVVEKVFLPEAYIIPPQWFEIISRLSIHGINYSVLDKEVSIEVNSYKFSNLKFNDTPKEGRQTLNKFNCEEVNEIRKYSAGSVLIDMNQRTSKVIAHMFEPKGPDSFIYWGFFNAIFEQKEYGETYVMEKIAREMIAKDENLMKEFEKYKTENKELADNNWALLNWFYAKTPYWDKQKNLYPVGRIMNRGIIEKIQRK